MLRRIFGKNGSSAPQTAELIRMDGITKVYDTGRVQVEALRGIDLDIERGEFVAVVGPSGSGKSTLMNLIGCLDTPSDGQYRLGGESVAGLGREQLADVRNRRIGFVFQNFNLLPQIGEAEADGETRAEQRIRLEMQWILERPDVEVAVSCLWAPVFFGHTQLIWFQTSAPADPAVVSKKLAAVPNIRLFEASDSFPTAVTEASGKNRLAVGRVRSVAKNSTEFSLLAVADNLRFGIAGNAVKILEVLVKDYL